MTSTVAGTEVPSIPLELPAPPGRRSTGRLGRLVRGRLDDAPWVRPALVALLTTTAVLYLWDLGASGWANSFYAAAVEAGTRSWKAFFFGSFDSSSFITVDKPPASLWMMELSARTFGLNSWSMLVPQALEGVATVALVYAAVRRWFRAPAALLAGTVVAFTPVAALMFRYNNPDALLVLLLTGAGYATMRAIERGRPRWLMLAGALVGFGFLTKNSSRAGGARHQSCLPGGAARPGVVACCTYWRGPRPWWRPAAGGCWRSRSPPPPIVRISAGRKTTRCGTSSSDTTASGA